MRLETRQGHQKGRSIAALDSATEKRGTTAQNSGKHPFPDSPASRVPHNLHRSPQNLQARKSTAECVEIISTVCSGGELSLQAKRSTKRALPFPTHHHENNHTRATRVLNPLLTDTSKPSVVIGCCDQISYSLVLFYLFLTSAIKRRSNPLVRSTPSHRGPG